jgi:hypothetical protein
MFQMGINIKRVSYVCLFDRVPVDFEKFDTRFSYQMIKENNKWLIALPDESNTFLYSLRLFNPHLEEVFRI